jgi:hypothetical protein
MSLDAKTLQLLTAKDQYLELSWLDSENFTYLSPQANGFNLIRQRLGATELLAEGLGSSLPYAGQFYSLTHYLKRDSELSAIDQSESVRLLGPSTDLRSQGDVHYLVSEVDGQDHIFEFRPGALRSLYETQSYIRHMSVHPGGGELIFLSWPRGSLPWFSAELMCWDKTTGGLLRLHPPGLDSPCGEADYSPCGNYLACSFLTDEFFQIWLYRFRTAASIPFRCGEARAGPLPF